MKLIFTTSKRTDGKPEAVNEIWKGKTWYYIIVRDEAGREYTASFDGGMEHPFSFPTGEEGTIGDYARALIEEISKGRQFYYNKGGNPFSNGSGEGLASALYRIYHGEEGVNAAKVRKANNGGMKIVSDRAEDQEEIKFCQDHFVHELTRQNLRSDSRGTHIHTTGVTVKADHGIMITSKGNFFFVDWNEDLHHFLCSIRTWGAHSGDLKVDFGTGGKIPLYWIADSFSRGEITRDTSIKTLRKLWKQRDDTKQVDHLTENKRNNFSWALIETNKGDNQRLLDYRSRIRAPYYFYTVNDRKRGRLLVECGVAGCCYRKRFVFEELGQEYLECFDAFKGYAKAAGCFSKSSPKGKSLLSYWGEPERAGDPQNPLVALLSEDINTFERYSKEVLADIPLLV